MHGLTSISISSGPGGRPIGLGGIDPLDAFSIYRVVGGAEPPQAVADAIASLQPLVGEYAQSNRHCDQDLGCGMLLWHASFFPDEVGLRVTVLTSQLFKLRQLI